MGIPRFLRFTGERYPCIIDAVKGSQVPEFDNLYLDMNGIIHMCSHSENINVNLTITDEQIFSAIFHYIDVLFGIIKPLKLLFLAVDGVAPRAKMNNQRGRRFRTNKELEEQMKKAAMNNVDVSKRFDSNAISPGTVFMANLHEQLQYYIVNKVSTDPLWQQCKVILSGHQTPGEGEHKIMDYLRYMKSQPDFDPNIRHCLYGGDADLIMLGLSLHLPYFSILREKVVHKNSNKILSPDEMKFQFVHLSIVRDYIDLEFQELREILPFKYNLENIIDDWILLGFLVGNDFIPNLPDLHINKNALPILYKKYKEVLPFLEGYLNENGVLNLPRFQSYMKKLAEHDMETFEETYANLAFLEGKMNASAISEKENISESIKNGELEELVKNTNDLFQSSDEEPYECDDYTFLLEFDQHKKNYYSNKLGYNDVTDEVLKSQAEGYIRAIQWNLYYYYWGCQSWSWFYPHHYAPYISDITNFTDINLHFDQDEPFLPFEQLMAILPAGSKDLVPKVYQHLMTSPDSPIIDFYPEDFEMDLNSKQLEWESVVLIPFIDQEKLVKAMKPYNCQLTKEEQKRNSHGPMHVYTYTEEDLGVYRSSANYFPSLENNHALRTDVLREEITVDKSRLKFGFITDVPLVHNFKFPTLKHIPHEPSLKNLKIKMFDSVAKNDSMKVIVKNKKFPPLQELADELLGKIVYVNWPYLIQSRVVGVSDAEMNISLKGSERHVVKHTPECLIQWKNTCKSLKEYYMRKMAIEVGSIDVVAHVNELEGRKYAVESSGSFSNKKIWSSAVVPHPLQVVIKSVSVDESNIEGYKSITEAFSIGSIVFMMDHIYFGCMGKILDNSNCLKYGRVKVALKKVSDPKWEPLEMNTTEYFSVGIVCAKLGLSFRTLSKITGCLLIDMSNDEHEYSGRKINIGLNLKSTKMNKKLPGFTKKENDKWKYSEKAVKIISEYIEKFPKIVECISNNSESFFYSKEEIFPDSDGVAEVKVIVEWLKEQEFYAMELVDCDDVVVEKEIVAEIEKFVRNSTKTVQIKNVQVKIQSLYKSDLVFGKLPPVPKAKHLLFDRVVSIKSSEIVPVGSRGYIIGIHKESNEEDAFYDVLFDEPFLGGLKLNTSDHRVYKMMLNGFLNITDANRVGYRRTMAEINCRISNPASQGVSQEAQLSSAFAQWKHQGVAATNDDDKNLHFHNMWSIMENSQPQEETNILKKILKIEDKNSSIEDPVKMFFNKMTVAPKEPPPLKILQRNKINPDKFIQCNPADPQLPENRTKYYIQLFSYYQQNNLGQPRFAYQWVDGKIMARVLFKDGVVYAGSPCENRESACESASLHALGALGVIKNRPPLDSNRDQRIKESGMKFMSALIKEPNDRKIKSTAECGPQNTIHGTTDGFNRQTHRNVPPSLPYPPMQWVRRNPKPQIQRSSQSTSRYPSSQQHRNPQRHFNEDFRDRNGAPTKPVPVTTNKSELALGFVPLQAITGKRNFRNIATTKVSTSSSEVRQPTDSLSAKAENSEAFINMKTRKSNDSSVKTKPIQRKPRRRIAANLNLDPNLYD